MRQPIGIACRYRTKSLIGKELRESNQICRSHFSSSGKKKLEICLPVLITYWVGPALTYPTNMVIRNIANPPPYRSAYRWRYRSANPYRNS